MTVKPKPPTMRMKCGDDLRLQMAVRDRLNEDAIAAKETYNVAYQEWRDAYNMDPPDQATIDAKYFTVEETLLAYETISIVDISDWVIQAKIGWSGVLFGTCTVSIEDAVNGIFLVYIPKELTASLKPREYDFEVKFTHTTGDILTSMSMKVILDKNIT